jgi:predicted RNA binding protein YcfA (HicA-like mRNA interferase family)
MGERGLPGELESQVLVDFVTERGFVYEKTEGSHMLFKPTKPGSPRVSIPKHGVYTRRGDYVLKNILDATGTTRSQFTKWFRGR